MIQVKITTIVILAILLVTIYSLFSIKNNVANLRYQLTTVTNQIKKEQDAIYLFKAEFASLTTPKRIKKLAYTYLHLENIKPSQLTQNPLDNNRDIPKIEYSKKINNKVKWRYKRSHNNYITTISNKK